LKELNCSNNNLTDLDIAGCYRLQKIDCSENNFVELEITNKYDLQELYCMNNKQLTSLNTTDSLLRKIDCSGCQIVSLSIYNNSYLTELNCSDNQLTSLTDFLEYAFADNFTFLNASNNKLADSDGSDNILETFANLTDLKTVDLSDNPLSISLKFFQHCGRLKELRIENTQITKGLEYLPESVKQIHCQGTKIADEELKNYFVEEE
jgi:Leucine-rich repeat (LRR) protein